MEASDASGIAAVEIRVHTVSATGDIEADSVLASSGPLSSPPYSYLWNTDEVPNGGYAIVAEAEDGAGNSAADSVDIELEGDRRPPVVVIRNPLDDAVVKNIVPVVVDAVDDSGIDSVWVVIRRADDTILEEAAFGAAPYALSWDTRVLPQGLYRVCARARDRAGNATAPRCASVHAYPLVVLQYDDGSAEAGRGEPNYTWQMAVVFLNPYDVPMVVDELHVFIHGSTPLGAAFRFVLWEVQDGRPGAEIEGTPPLAVRNPRNTFGYWNRWTTVVPAGGAIAAGWQQTGTEATVVGMDGTSPYRDDTFFFSFPAGASSWVTFEFLGYTGVPMIRLHVSAFTGRLPGPGSGSPRAAGSTYGILGRNVE